VKLSDMTWKCDICRSERPDSAISVRPVDITPANLAPGTAMRNVKYCNDNPLCKEAAENWKETR
jgi:hypothetical protein